MSGARKKEKEGNKKMSIPTQDDLEDTVAKQEGSRKAREANGDNRTESRLAPVREQPRSQLIRLGQVDLKWDKTLDPLKAGSGNRGM